MAAAVIIVRHPLHSGVWMSKRPVVVVLAVWLALGPGLVAGQSAEPDLAAGIRQVEEGD